MVHAGINARGHSLERGDAEDGSKAEKEPQGAFETLVTVLEDFQLEAVRKLCQRVAHVDRACESRLCKAWSKLLRLFLEPRSSRLTQSCTAASNGSRVRDWRSACRLEA